MNTGPKATTGFDLALTEILEPDHHYFVCEVGTEAGTDVLTHVPHQTATIAQHPLADQVVEETAAYMGRTLDTEGIKELLYSNLEYVDLLIDCASNVRFDAGDFIFRQGEDANYFYLIRHGTVAIEISSPQHQAITIKTIGEKKSWDGHGCFRPINGSLMPEH